jgi:hypothetical protein|tara:strand:+ start:256 stop:480 length:225 start_codon:yes stop_codon:yes gene_type:complete
MIYDVRKITSLIILRAVFTTAKPYTSRKKINIAKTISDKIENFCDPPLWRRADRKDILKSSLLIAIYPVNKLIF